MVEMKMIRMAGLQLFAEGAAAAGTGGEGSDAGSQNTGAGIADAGAQAEQTQTQVSAEQQESFDDLIKGRYKQDFDSRVQKIVQSRLKGVNGRAEKYDKAAPLIDAIAQRYGIADSGDIDAILKAFDTDNALLEAEASEKNMPIEQLKAMKQLERENAMFRRQSEQMQQEQQVRQQVDKWTMEAEEAKRFYPELDLAAEIQNPEFVKLLQANVGVKTAYQAIHGDDIMQAGMQAAMRSAEEKLAKSVAAGKNRPVEGAAGGGGAAASMRTDVSKLSGAEVRDYMRRVAMGERISFG